jgi:hypothetical protein
MPETVVALERAELTPSRICTVRPVSDASSRGSQKHDAEALFGLLLEAAVNRRERQGISL